MNRIIGVMVAGCLLTVSAMAGSEVGRRAENQQDRIGQGVQSGSLTAGETANLEKKEAAVNQEVRADRKLNGGHLTKAEKRQVNQQQNKLSRQIYRDKHNSGGRHRRERPGDWTLRGAFIFSAGRPTRRASGPDTFPSQFCGTETSPRSFNPLSARP